MENIYKFDWDDDHCKAGHNGIVTTSWSSINLFAFTTQKEIDGFTKKYLNILNPNQPWNVFLTQYKGGDIMCLHWNRMGNHLLSCDSHGSCYVWSLFNHMINLWSAKSCHNVELAGEEILAVRWLHPGIRIVFHIDKMDAVNLNEKFQRSVFKPSIAQYGGKHLDGYIFVTSSGLIHVQCFDSDTEPTFGRFNLNVPCHQRIADIQFTSQGKILILISTGDLHHMIQFFEVSLAYNTVGRTISFEVKSLPSIPVQCVGEEPCIYTHISHAKFASHENHAHVLICVSSSVGSRFEGWVMIKNEVTLPRLQQQGSSNSSQLPKTWKFIKSSENLPKVLDFSVPANAIDNFSVVQKISQDKKFYCGLTIAVSLADNSIQILSRLLLQSLLTLKLGKQSENQQQITSSTPCLRSATFSPLSCALIGIDDGGNLFLFKVFPWLNSINKSPLEAKTQIVQLLLYCMVTGQDWWEVLLHVKGGFVNNIIEALVNEIKKQSTSMQQPLYCRTLSMKITLYQISNNAAATDCHLKLLFHAMALVFRSHFRPPQQVTSEDSDPSLRLQAVCRTSTSTDINQLLQHADAMPQSLQAMQQLIQWVADVTLYLLASVPYHHMGKVLSRPGSMLIRDNEWLTLLRELLVIMHVWSLLASACLPVFQLLDSKLEVLPHIFRLVSLLWQTCLPENIQKEIPSTLINECCLLPSQIIIPPLEIIPAVNGVLTHMASGVLHLKYGETHRDVALATARQRRTELVSLPGSSGKIDFLRRVYLGKRPVQELKECTRCGIISMYNNPRPSLLKMWDQRFVKSCLCGGMWRKMGPS